MGRPLLALVIVAAVGCRGDHTKPVEKPKVETPAASPTEPEKEASTTSPPSAPPYTALRMLDDVPGATKQDNLRLALSPTGTQLAYVGGEGLHVVDSATAETRRCPEKATGMYFSVVYLDDHHLFADGELLAVGPDETCRSVASVAFKDTANPISRGDGTVIFTGADGEVQSIGVDGKTQSLVTTGLPVDFAVAPGDRVVVGTYQGAPSLQGAGTLQAFEDDPRSHAVAVSPDGTLLATAGDRGGLWLVDLMRWKLAKTVAPPASTIGTSLRVEVAFLGAEKILAAWDDVVAVYDLEGKVVFETREISEDSPVVVDPLGRFLAFGRAREGQPPTISVVDSVTLEPQAELESHERPLSDLAIDASGKYLASASKDPRIVLWTLPGS